MQVLDLDSQTLLGEIAPTPGVHGVAIAPELGRGFISDGGDATVTVFDTKTLAKTATLKVDGNKPDAILYEPFSHRVFTLNGDSENTSAFDAATGKPAGTLALGGAPEFAVSDGAGAAYVNLEDKAETLRFDPVTLKVTARWTLAPAHTPTGLAIDTAAHRLLVTCRSKHLVVLDSDTGARIAELPIGAGVDAIALDAAHRRAFGSCGDSTVSVVAWDKAGKYRIAKTLATEAGARTLAYDAKAQRLYLSAAGRAPAKDGKRGAAFLPGTFGLLVIDVTETGE